MLKFLLCVGVIAVAAIVYNLDSIIGQRKFDKLCEREGGSRFYAQLEKDAGWEVQSQDEQAYKVPFNFGHVAFVRYRNKQGEQLDVHIKNGPSPWSKDFDVTPADLTNTQPKYRLTIEQGLLADDERMSRTHYEITDVQRARPLASHTYFSYRWTRPERVILDASTSVTCHGGAEVSAFASQIYQSR